MSLKVKTHELGSAHHVGIQYILEFNPADGGMSKVQSLDIFGCTNGQVVIDASQVTVGDTDISFHNGPTPSKKLAKQNIVTAVSTAPGAVSTTVVSQMFDRNLILEFTGVPTAGKVTVYVTAKRS